jgi:DNA-binding transcriptional MerR regulator
VLTIGRLARLVGVSTKTIRVYHAKGLLPEPDRDASGYRRYTAQDAVVLIRIRTLAEAGVPLARIRELRTASAEEFRQAMDEMDGDLTRRIDGLRRTQLRLRQLARTGDSGRGIPAEVAHFLARLRDLGLSERWIAMEQDLWTLVVATHPELAADLLADQLQTLDDPDARQLYLDYDRLHDLCPHDPAVDDLARRIVAATRRRYGSGELPGQAAGSEVPALIQAELSASSPAWRRLDSLVRAGLVAAG